MNQTKIKSNDEVNDEIDKFFEGRGLDDVVIGDIKYIVKEQRDADFRFFKDGLDKLVKQIKELKEEMLQYRKDFFP